MRPSRDTNQIYLTSDDNNEFVTHSLQQGSENIFLASLKRPYECAGPTSAPIEHRKQKCLNADPHQVLMH